MKHARAVQNSGDNFAQGDGSLFVTESECARRLGFSPEAWRRMRVKYARLHLPAPDAISKRRYWPAVKAFFDRIHGLENHGTVASFPENEEEENLDALNTARRKRARS